MFLQPFRDPICQPLYSFVVLEGGSTPGVRLTLRHLWFIAMNAVTPQLAADRAVVAAQPSVPGFETGDEMRPLV